MSAEIPEADSHPLAAVSRTRLRCRACAREVSVYAADGDPTAICECGTLMEAIVDE